MRLLLDSNALYWVLMSPEKLTPQARKALMTPGTVRFFSVASVWELEIKRAKGKLALPETWLDMVFSLGLVELRIESRDAAASARLPWHHADPFDRMLIAQAKQHGLTLVSRDSVFANYQVSLLKA